jgi:hypothetical protein
MARLAGSAAPLLGVLLAHSLIRLLYHTLYGVEFDASSLRWFWQYIDPALLQHDALRSIMLHHAQPPLFNALLAVALKLSGAGADLAAAAPWLHAIFFGFGLVLQAALFGLLRALGLGNPTAAAATLLFSISPASILYEHWLFYTYPTTALLVASALALHRTLRRGAGIADAVLLFTLLAAATLTRSLLHLVWMFSSVALVVYVSKQERRRLLLCAALPCLIAFSLYAKNAAVFGLFSSSSWMGMNFSRLSTEHLPLPERLDLQRAGKISEVSLVPAFSKLDRYPAHLRDVESPDHPVLRAVTKSTGAPNFNHAAYVGISEAYFDDALTLIALDPGGYLSRVGHAWLIFMMPPSEYWFLEPNREKIRRWETFFDAVFYGVASAYGANPVRYDRTDRAYLLYRFSVLWAVLASLGVGYGLAAGVRETFFAGGDRARGLCLLYIAGTALYVAVAGNALELRENNRFRFLIEPFVLALILCAGQQGVARIRAGAWGSGG